MYRRDLSYFKRRILLAGRRLKKGGRSQKNRSSSVIENKGGIYGKFYSAFREEEGEFFALFQSKQEEPSQLHDLAKTGPCTPCSKGAFLVKGERSLKKGTQTKTLGKGRLSAACGKTGGRREKKKSV